MVAYLLLLVAQAAGLLMIVYGWPGGWLQLASLALFGWWTGLEMIGAIPLGLLAATLLLADLIKPVVAPASFDPLVRRRAAIAAMVGGAMGAAAGFIFPLIGMLFGALAGSLLGSASTAIGMRSQKNGYAPLSAQLAIVGIRTAAGISVAIFSLLTITL